MIKFLSNLWKIFVLVTMIPTAILFLAAGWAFFAIGLQGAYVVADIIIGEIFPRPPARKRTAAPRATRPTDFDPRHGLDLKVEKIDPAPRIHDPRGSGMHEGENRSYPAAEFMGETGFGSFGSPLLTRRPAHEGTAGRRKNPQWPPRPS